MRLAGRNFPANPTNVGTLVRISHGAREMRVTPPSRKNHIAPATAFWLIDRCNLVAVPLSNPLVENSFSTEREIHSSGGFGSVQTAKLQKNILSLFVIRSRWSKCCFQEGTTISIRNLFGCFKSSYKCHLSAPFRKKIRRASRINSTHSFRRVGSNLEFCCD